MKAFIVKKEIAIKAAPDKVWDALTNPEKTKKYFFRTKVRSDWKAGSKIAFEGRFLFIIKFEMSGKILDIEPEKLLKYNLENRRSGSTSVVTDKLSCKNGVTTLSITDDVGQGKGAEKRYKRSVKGWDKILNGLKELVEKEG